MSRSDTLQIKAEKEALFREARGRIRRSSYDPGEVEAALQHFEATIVGWFARAATTYGRHMIAEARGPRERAEHGAAAPDALSQIAWLRAPPAPA